MNSIKETKMNESKELLKDNKFTLSIKIKLIQFFDYSYEDFKI